MKKKLSEYIFSFAWLLPIIFALLTIFIRVPFMSKCLYYVDSVIYALGMERFDIQGGIPAAPGLIGYICLGKIFNCFTGDPNMSLVLVGMLFSGLACGMGYLLGKEMFGTINGLITALLLLTSPLVWFFGEIAMPVISNLFFSALVAFFCYRTITGTKLSYLALSALSLGIGASFRQDLLLFMLPLWFFAACHRPIRQIAIGFIVVFMSSLIWVIPSSISAGGLLPYLALCKERIFGQAGHISYLTASNIFIKKAHVYNYFLTLLTALFLGIFPFVYYLGRFFNLKKVISDKKIQFLLIWILPLFIYMNLVGGGRGYSFVHLPALFIYLSLTLESIKGDFLKAGFARFGKSIVPIALFIIMGVNVFFFLHDPHPEKRWRGNSWFRVSDVRKRDDMLGIKIDYIKEKFAPYESIIFTGAAHQTYWPVFYYLPLYKVFQPNAIFWKEGIANYAMEMAYRHKRSLISDTLFKIPEGIKNIVFFDEDICPYIRGSSNVERILLDKGYCLCLLRLREEKYIKLDFHNMELF